MSRKLRQLHNSWCRDTGIDSDNEHQINCATALARVLIDQGDSPLRIELKLTRLDVPPKNAARMSWTLVS